jgi:hypothetical protein
MLSDFNCFAAEFEGNGGAFFIKMALFGEYVYSIPLCERFVMTEQ